MAAELQADNNAMYVCSGRRQSLSRMGAVDHGREEQHNGRGWLDVVVMQSKDQKAMRKETRASLESLANVQRHLQLQVCEGRDEQVLPSRWRKGGDASATRDR